MCASKKFAGISTSDRKLKCVI